MKIYDELVARGLIAQVTDEEGISVSLNEIIYRTNITYLDYIDIQAKLSKRNKILDEF